jgi:hypothetical protein
MTLIRIKTVQGHPVPSVVGGGVPPWEAQLFHRPGRLPSQETFSEFPAGATVQNGMQGVPLFSCDTCGDIVAESEMDAHVCGYIPDDEDELAETDDDW